MRNIDSLKLRKSVMQMIIHTKVILNQFPYIELAVQGAALFLPLQQDVRPVVDFTFIY